MPVIQETATIVSCNEVADGIFLLQFRSNHLAVTAQPGQFINVNMQRGSGMLLRRPFSISRIEGDIVEILFNVIGKGTKYLSSLHPGDDIDYLGPLGKPFGYNDDFKNAILVGGGLGVAPLPLLTQRLREVGKSISTFLGSRSAHQLILKNLENVHIATDDGSRGFHGTVIDQLRDGIEKKKIDSAKIFGCGPTPMLRSLSKFAEDFGFECEISLEGDMACGIGLCQGCPVELKAGTKKYSLVCSEGPSFNSQEVNLR